MDFRMQELVEFTQKKFGLSNYYLHEQQFYRSVDIFNKTIYTLSMEWFPNDAVQDDDGLNPEGTVSFEINLKSRKFERIFVKGKPYAEDGITFSNLNKEAVIKWIESETALTYGEQFQLIREEDGEFYFMSCVDSVTVYPPGYIDIKFNEEGKLTMFSMHGEFPSKKLIKEEKYALSLDRLEDLGKEQLKLIEYPSYEQKK